MKKILLVVAVVIFIAKITNAQDVQVNGKSFQTVKKTVLNDKTEFYQLKEKGKAGAKRESYIKAGDKFHKTVFTETQLESFFKTASISSLGKVEEKKINESRTIRYISNGSKTVFMVRKENQLSVYEYNGSVIDVISTARANDDIGGGITGEHLECRQGCGRIDDECRKEFGPQQEYPDNDVCFNDWLACLDRCDKAFARGGKGSNHSLYTLTVNTVKITR